jgi:WD40 repeat protein
MGLNGLNENELIVPVVLWGDRAPTHCISCIHLSRDLRTLVTGCNDGQLILWDFSFEPSASTFLTPRCMLFGHTASVLCIANGNLNMIGTQYIVSSTENGSVKQKKEENYLFTWKLSF